MNAVSWRCQYYCVIQPCSDGLRPSGSPTRSLASRCAGSLRSRGSLRYARSRFLVRVRAELRPVDLTQFTFNVPFVSMDPQKALRELERLALRLGLEDC